MPPRPSTVAGSYHYDDYGRSRPAARTRLSLLPNLDKKEVFAQFKPKKPKSNYGEAPAKRPPKGRYGRSPIRNRDSQIHPRGSPNQFANKVTKEIVDKDADLVHTIVTQEEFAKGCFHLKDFAPGALPAVPSQNLQGGMGSLSRVGSAAPEKQESFADVEEETPRGLHLILPFSGPGEDAQYEERLLSDIPARVACEKYKTVSVDGWHLMEKDPVFESTDQLVRVPLTNEQAANAGVHETPSELGQRLVKRLNYDLQKKQRPHTPKRHLPGVPKLSKAVGSGETVLNLSDSKMGPRQVCALAFTLPQQTAISTLILSKNTIDDGCCELLVAALRIEPNISQLDLSHNKIGVKGAALLSALFKVDPPPSLLSTCLPLTTLQLLELEEERGGALAHELEEGEKGSAHASWRRAAELWLSRRWRRAVELWLTSWRMAVELWLTSWRIVVGSGSRAGGLRWSSGSRAGGLAVELTAHELEDWRWALAHEAGGGAAELLAPRAGGWRCSSGSELEDWRELWLTSWRSGGGALAHELEALKALCCARQKIPEGKTRFTPVITMLNVRGNPLGNSGVSRLITEFRSTSCPLRNLDVAECQFTEKGAHQLGEMLLVNRSLTTMNLSWNKVGIKGAQTLATAIASHPRLMSLNMAHVGMSDAGTGYIASALSENFTIQHLDISNNTIRGGACAVLASSVVARGHIDFLDLSNNPLGQMGAARLLKTFTAGFVKKVGLQGCNFVDLSQSNSGVVNERNPNGSYSLDLSNPLQYQQAADLATLWKDHGPQSWQESKLDGKTFKLTDALKWPDHMPRVGQLKLRFQSANARPVKITPLSEEEFTNMWSSAIGPSATDEWKVTFAMLLSTTVYLTAEQVAKMLSTFTWPSERLEAAMTLFGRITDPHNQHHIDAQLTSETRVKYEKELGPLRQFHPYNPTGHYNLNLTRKVDYCIATQLLAYYAQEESDGICSKERLQKSWRNIVLNGRYIESMDPHSWEVPTEGSLKLDYVSYNLPDTKKSTTKYNTLSDLRLLALEAVLCLNRQPEPLKIEAFTKPPPLLERQPECLTPFGMYGGAGWAGQAYFHQHFMELWNLNFNRKSSKETRMQAMKEAKEMMKGSKSNRFKRRATQVANVVGMLSSRSNQSSRDGSVDGDANESIPKGFTVGLPPGTATSNTRPRKGSATVVEAPSASGARSRSKTDGKAPKSITPTPPRTPHGERSSSISGTPRRPLMDEPETWDPTSTGIKDFHTALNCLRVLSVTQYISVKHLSRLLDLFAVSDEHVIEVVVIFWQRILDRARFPELMKKISKKAQAGIGQRLGPLNIFNGNMPDHHWLLRLSQRDEHEVLKRLVRIAVKDTTCNSVNNLYINGRQMPRITEDESLYTVLSGHVQDGMIPTNVLEFDFELSKLNLQNTAAKLIQTKFKALKKRMMAKGTWGKKRKK
ncbi:hypothetical protein CYMTET_53941 [Cymbomonas tetramitiformis]|uniref:DUF4476 domain-containing protein n=1 Tax=Cymbomonas tetramitiformis TaxID=36881 RepID=A0AAE0BFW0_9CHLO|nr:hypothetical protein CYMTET_53941 [Cymbomonas tetramitiformis]